MLGMAFPPFLVKQLHGCDSVVISSFVNTGYTTRRWGWLLGRIGYSIGITTTYNLIYARIAKELKTPTLDKVLKYKRSWIQYVNRMPRNRLPRVMKHYSPTGRKNQGRPLNRLLDTWDRNESTSGPTPWEIYDDDGEGSKCNKSVSKWNLQQNLSRQTFSDMLLVKEYFETRRCFIAITFYRCFRVRH